MSKAKKLTAAALAVLALAAPTTSIALNGGGERVQLACGGTSGGCI
jgi:hypothetical protein